MAMLDHPDTLLDMPMPGTLDVSVAREILRDHDSSALACLVSAAALLGDDLFDEEDGQPWSEQELGWLFEHTGFKPLPASLSKITGLLFARSGDEFTDSPEHFERLTSAIVEGDMFAYQDDKEDPTVPDLYWALYQVGLTIEEDDMLDELSPRVEKYIQRLIEDEVEDVEGLAAEVAEEGSDPDAIEPYVTRILVFRRAMMAADLRRLGCKAEWLADLDPELAHDLELYDS